jgi:hypothetical protein
MPFTCLAFSIAAQFEKVGRRLYENFSRSQLEPGNEKYIVRVPHHLWWDHHVWESFPRARQA